MEKMNIEGINIAYIRRGKGEPLVLIHGYPLDHTIWNQVGSSLEKEFDLIVPDLRGFGDSDAKQSDHSILDYARDIAGLMSQLKLKKAFLAGHSMGGYVALAFALEFPERVSGLAMISSQTLSDTPERKEGRLSTAKEVMEKGVGIVADSMTPKLSKDQGIQEYVRKLINQQSRIGISNALKAMAGRPDTTQQFATFKFPVVIVHGDADELIPVERGREMKAALPASQYYEFKGLGHMAMMEEPEAVKEALSSLRK